MKAYWKNKSENPWDRIYKTLAKEMSDQEDESLLERVMLVREAVFCGLDMISLSLALDVGANELLSIMTNEKQWKDGRREARSRCVSLLKKKIEEGKVDYIVESGLEKDGFAYLIPEVREARVAKFKEAKPTLDTKKVDLTPLRKSRYGRQLLRSLNIVETSLDTSDDRVEQLVETYEHQLLELELSDTAELDLDEQTQQITLNGVPVDSQEKGVGEEIRKTRPAGTGRDFSSQEELTDYVEESLKEVEYAGDLQALDGIGPAMESKLRECGYDSFVAIAHAQVEELSASVHGVGSARAKMLIEGARKLLDGGKEGGAS
jgi:predicted flap endonuclease-1-like 5' DNA nuclease